MKLETGLHIGASKDTMDIGGIDSPVVRDPLTNEPFIPGSSLKGKLRSLYERSLLGKTVNGKKFEYNTKFQNIERHQCSSYDEGKQCPVCRLFGSTGNDSNCPSRTIFRDLHLTDDSLKKLETIDTGLYLTEWKFENSIDRITSAAMPRQIERIPAGSEFKFEIIYNIEDQDTWEEDLRNLKQLFNLLQNDYLGGHGSRGYGKVSFRITSVIKRSREYYFEKDNEEDLTNKF